jgi:hypothetical protein
MVVFVVGSLICVLKGAVDNVLHLRQASRIA